MAVQLDGATVRRVLRGVAEVTSWGGAGWREVSIPLPEAVERDRAVERLVARGRYASLDAQNILGLSLEMGPAGENLIAHAYVETNAPSWIAWEVIEYQDLRVVERGMAEVTGIGTSPTDVVVPLAAAPADLGRAFLEIPHAGDLFKNLAGDKQFMGGGFTLTESGIEAKLQAAAAAQAGVIRYVILEG